MDKFKNTDFDETSNIQLLLLRTVKSNLVNQCNNSEFGMFTTAMENDARGDYILLFANSFCISNIFKHDFSLDYLAANQNERIVAERKFNTNCRGDGVR